MNLDDSKASSDKVSYRGKIFGLIRTSLLNLNLFEAHYNDAHGRRNEIIATRVYLAALIIGLTVITFYASLVEYSVTYRVRNGIFIELRNFQMTYLGRIAISRSISQINQSTYKFDM